MEKYESIKKVYIEFLAEMNAKNDLKPMQRLVIEYKVVKDLKEKAQSYGLEDEIIALIKQEAEINQKLSQAGVSFK